jgi:polyhydroxyalkanoate synthase
LLQQETAANPVAMQRALAGLRKYQEAVRAAPPAPPAAVAQRLGAQLRDYGGGSGSGAGGAGLPVLFVPSLINPPTVLDLGQRSLLRWLATQGRRVLLLDWGWPDARRSTLSVAGHVETILLPLMAELGEPVDLVGYCLGGTMAVAAAQLGRARSLATIAAPWRFSGFPDEARAGLASMWDRSRNAVDLLGVLPMEALQSAFWSLDPARTILKFADFADATGDAAAAFIALEDWANDGPPIAAAAARETLEDFFAADLPGAGRWRVAGTLIDPAALAIPMLNIVSTTDRIVPRASAIPIGERIELAQGHVGMVVGTRARAALWQPLAAWLSRNAAQC